MLAGTHALSGAAAWLALTPVVHADRPAEIAGGAVMAAGAALMPDLDHHSGTAAKTWGPITRVLGRLVAKATGGHRKGTHTLLAIAAAYGVTYLAVQYAGWAAVAVVAVLVGLALVACEDIIPGRWERLWPVNLVVSIAAACAAVAVDLDLTWLPAAVAVGWAAHIAGDTITEGGCPLLAPLTSRRYRLTYLNTGGLWEKAVAAILTAAIAVLSVATMIAQPDPWTTLWPTNQERLDERLDKQLDDG